MIAADLYRIVSDAILFASKDTTRPFLCVARLEVTSAGLIAVATDRFSLGIARADYDGEAFTASFSRGDLVNLLKVAKTAKRDESWRRVELEIERDQRDESVKAITFTFTDGGAMTLRAQDYEFPKYRQLFPSAQQVDDASGLVHVGVNPALFARFDKVSGSAAAHVAFTAGNRPIVVRKGPDFLGLLMPTRLGDLETSAHVRPDWLDAGAPLPKVSLSKA